MKILALDVEGTIILGYEHNILDKDTGRLPAFIDKNLKTQLLILSENDFKIVLVTGIEGDNLEYYQKQFRAIGMSALISAYLPRDHHKDDGKADKLSKYQAEFEIVSKDDIYFFDDAPENVKQAIAKGFNNSYCVTKGSPLATQLKNLVKNLGLSSGYHEDVARDGDSYNGGYNESSTLFSNPKNNRGKETNNGHCCILS